MNAPHLDTDEPDEDEGCTYQGVVEHIDQLYDGKIGSAEAHEAARNFITFCQLLLEIQNQRP